MSGQGFSISFVLHCDLSFLFSVISVITDGFFQWGHVRQALAGDCGVLSAGYLFPDVALVGKVEFVFPLGCLPSNMGERRNFN